jgi:hypothetical protein
MLKLANESGRFSGFHEKVGKIAEKGFWSTDLLRQGHGEQRSQYCT